MKALKGDILYPVTMQTPAEHKGGYVVLSDSGEILFVGDKLEEKYADVPVTDYGDNLIIPAFVDMHLHAPQYPMLGMGMDMELIDWLSAYVYKTEARFADAEYARRIYHKLADELISWGITRVVMFSSLHTEATWILMEELEKAGVTGYVGKVNMDRNGSPELQETTEQSMAETLRWLDGCHRFKYVKPIITPRFTPSCTDELMAFLGKLANERNLRVQSHLSENLGEVEWVRELHPDCKYYWETYDKYGLWKSHTVMAHCVHSDKNERRAMREAGVVMAHCADSNINLSSGIAPVRAMMDEGIWVAFGSDIAGGAQIAMPKVITMSIRASKLRAMMDEKKPRFLSVPEAYYLGSAAGAQYFDPRPVFSPGTKLHAVVIDEGSFTEPAREISMVERFERAIYRMGPKDVAAVWSEGRLVRGK